MNLHAAFIGTLLSRARAQPSHDERVLSRFVQKIGKQSTKRPQCATIFGFAIAAICALGQGFPVFAETPLVVVATQKGRRDALGDPLPTDALTRLGTLRHRISATDSRPQRLADGKTVLICVNDEVRWMDLVTGRITDSWSLPKGHSVCGFAEDGRWVLLAASKKKLSLWDLMARRAIREFQVTDSLGDQVSARFSLDGRAVITNHGVNYNSGLMRVWNVATGQELWHDGVMGFFDRGFSPLGFLDGQIVVVQDWSNNWIRLRDLRTGREHRSFATLPRRDSRMVLLSPDGSIIFVGTSGAAVRVWDVATGRELPPVGAHKEQAYSIAVSRDSKTVLTAGSDAFIQVWDWPARRLRRKIELPRGGSAPRMDVSANGKRADITMEGEQALRFFDLETAKELSPQTQGHRGPVCSLAITANGEVVSAGTDNTIRLWDLKSGRHLREILTQYPVGACSVAVNADGQIVASADFNAGTVRLHNVATGSPVASIGTGEASVRHVSFASSDGLLAVSGDKLNPGNGDSRGFLTFYDVKSGKEVRRLQRFAGGKLVFGPDARVLACFEGDQIRLVDVASGRVRFALPRKGATALAFSPSGTMLACSSTTDITIWEIASAKERGVIKELGTSSTSLRFSRDGRWLAHSGHERTIHLYDLLRGQKSHDYTGHDALVTGLEFSPDGRSLVSSSYDSTMISWNVVGVTAELPLVVPPPQMADVVAAWNDLANQDARVAYRALALLLASPAHSLPLLRENLKPATALDAKHVERLLSKLDSPLFPEREEASRALDRLGEDIEPALEHHLTLALSLEAKRRTQAILSKARGPITDSSRLRQIRAIEALEMLGSSKAMRVLHTLAEGTSESRITREARAALRRLSQKPGNSP